MFGQTDIYEKSHVNKVFLNCPSVSDPQDNYLVSESNQ